MLIFESLIKMKFFAPVFSLLQYCLCENNGNLLLIMACLFIHGKISDSGNNWLILKYVSKIYGLIFQIAAL